MPLLSFPLDPLTMFLSSLLFYFLCDRLLSFVSPYESPTRLLASRAPIYRPRFAFNVHQATRVMHVVPEAFAVCRLYASERTCTPLFSRCLGGEKKRVSSTRQRNSRENDRYRAISAGGRLTKSVRESMNLPARE